MTTSLPMAVATYFALGAASASALTISPNPVFLNDQGLVGSIELVDVVTGLPTGGVVGDGAVGATDTTLVFQANVVASPLDAWTFILVILRSASGFIAPTATGGVDPDNNLDQGVIDNIPGGVNPTALFSGSVPEGVTSDRFFVSYAGPLATDGSLGFFLRAGVPLQPGPGFSVADGTALVVPEPATALLLTLGAALTCVNLTRTARGLTAASPPGRPFPIARAPSAAAR